MVSEYQPWGGGMSRGSLIVLALSLGVGGGPVVAGPLGGKTDESPGVQTSEKAPAPGKTSTPDAAGPGPVLPGLPWSRPDLPWSSPAFPWSSPGTPATLTMSPRPLPTPAVTPDKPAKPAAMPPPIAFFVAKGEPDACGRDCAEWIAAEGTFDNDAPQRLRAVLGRLGKRKLPIYFHSSGGSVAAAIAIGRLLRERGLTAGVAW